MFSVTLFYDLFCCSDSRNKFFDLTELKSVAHSLSLSFFFFDFLRSLFPQEARIARDGDGIKSALKEYDDSLEQFVISFISHFLYHTVDYFSHNPRISNNSCPSLQCLLPLYTFPFPLSCYFEPFPS